MATEHQEKIETVLNQKNTIDKINNLLADHGLAGFSVKSLQLQLNNDLIEKKVTSCPDGQEPKWICTPGHSCELRCVPKIKEMD